VAHGAVASVAHGAVTSCGARRNGFIGTQRKKRRRGAHPAVPSTRAVNQIDCRAADRPMELPV
jgi:hypothetical protein